MKNSQFNLFFPWEETIVGYNSLENDFIFLTNDLYDIYREVSSGDINNLQTVHPDFWKLLKEKNFVVSDDKDELQAVKELVRSIDDSPSQYHMMINPTMDCNFKCWYCYETHVKGSNMQAPEMEKLKKHIVASIDSGTIRHFTISWFGGEPLLYYKQVVLPILEFTHAYVSDKKEVCFSSNFTSNGYFINDKMVEDFKRLNVDFLQITLDGYRDRHDKVRHNKNGKGSYDKIVENIKRCVRASITISCRINISADTLTEDIHRILEDFLDLSPEEREFISFSFHKVWQEKENLNDDILQLIDLFESHHFRTEYNKYNDTVQNSCYADKVHQATLNYNGDVFKCSAREFSTESREGVLNEAGEIEWNEKYHKRMQAKFNNPPCLTCNILPICNGSCSQTALENSGRDYCIHNYSEESKVDVVKNKLKIALS